MKKNRFKRIFIEVKKFLILITPPLFVKFFNFGYYKKFNKKSLDSLNKIFKIENWGIDVKSYSENCVILCNGPSLNQSINDEYNFIANHTKIVVNFSPCSSLFWDLKPEFLVLVDPSFWVDNISHQLKEKINELNKNLIRVDWSLKIIMPNFAKDKNHILSSVKKDNIEIIYINSAQSNKVDLQDRLIDYKVNKSSPLFQSVSVAALYFAINIGFKKIYLFGYDHDWIKNMKINEKNQIVFRDNHYYDNSEKESEVINSTLLEEYKAQYQLHLSYQELSKYEKEMGVKVFNCTKNSMLDSFERLNYLGSYEKNYS
jgi:hypothetical protein